MAVQWSTDQKPNRDLMEKKIGSFELEPFRAPIVFNFPPSKGKHFQYDLPHEVRFKKSLRRWSTRPIQEPLKKWKMKPIPFSKNILAPTIDFFNSAEESVSPAKTAKVKKLKRFKKLRPAEHISGCRGKMERLRMKMSKCKRSKGGFCKTSPLPDSKSPKTFPPSGGQNSRCVSVEGIIEIFKTTKIKSKSPSNNVITVKGNDVETFPLETPRKDVAQGSLDEEFGVGCEKVNRKSETTKQSIQLESLHEQSEKVEELFTKRKTRRKVRIRHSKNERRIKMTVEQECAQTKQVQELLNVNFLLPNIINGTREIKRSGMLAFDSGDLITSEILQDGNRRRNKNFCESYGYSPGEKLRPQRTIFSNNSPTSSKFSNLNRSGSNIDVRNVSDSASELISTIAFAEESETIRGKLLKQSRTRENVQGDNFSEEIKTEDTKISDVSDNIPQLVRSKMNKSPEKEKETQMSDEKSLDHIIRNAPKSSLEISKSSDTIVAEGVGYADTTHEREEIPNLLKNATNDAFDTKNTRNRYHLRKEINFETHAVKDKSKSKSEKNIICDTEPNDELTQRGFLNGTSTQVTKINEIHKDFTKLHSIVHKIEDNFDTLVANKTDPKRNRLEKQDNVGGTLNAGSTDRKERSSILQTANSFRDVFDKKHQLEETLADEMEEHEILTEMKPSEIPDMLNCTQNQEKNEICNNKVTPKSDMSFEVQKKENFFVKDKEHPMVEKKTTFRAIDGTMKNENKELDVIKKSSLKANKGLNTICTGSVGDPAIKPKKVCHYLRSYTKYVLKDVSTDMNILKTH